MSEILPTTVVDLFRELFPNYRGAVTGELVAADVEGWDSLRHAELIFALEDALGKPIDATAAFEAPNLGALIASAGMDWQS
jgi:acyl carrier protein